MICSQCYNDKYKTAKTELTIIVDGEQQILRDIECKICPSCGDITFTHVQSLEIDKRRISLEFGLKPLLTADQLKTLRKILNIKLEDICDLLRIGRNSYGRWERGEVVITPSMNLLVHALIDKIPDARVNLLTSERVVAIEKANSRILAENISFGEYIREVISTTKLLPDIICTNLGIEMAELLRVQNNELAPEKIDPDLMGKMAYYFRLSFDVLTQLLNNALNIISMKNSVTAVHARSTCYDGKEIAIQTSSVNKIMEKLAQKKSVSTQPQVDKEYLKKVAEVMIRLNGTEV